MLPSLNIISACPALLRRSTPQRQQVYAPGSYVDPFFCIPVRKRGGRLQKSCAIMGRNEEIPVRA